MNLVKKIINYIRKLSLYYINVEHYQIRTRTGKLMYYALNYYCNVTGLS